MGEDQEKIAKSEAGAAVRQMGRMLAAFYYHLARQLIAELGEERATAILGRAVAAYGADRGARHREKALAAGLGGEPEDYVRLPDLPPFGWEATPVDNGENATHIRITYCPFAEYWQERDFAAIGRIYCGVDQAKYRAFHPGADLVHLKNVLDGDDCCEMVCRKNDAVPPVAVNRNRRG